MKKFYKNCNLKTSSGTFSIRKELRKASIVIFEASFL